MWNNNHTQHPINQTPKPSIKVRIRTQDFGVILHQPLNPTKKRKNTKKGQKMNGVPVYPGHFLQNAPTWRLFFGSFWPLFWPNFAPFYRIPTPNSYCPKFNPRLNKSPTPTYTPDLILNFYCKSPPLEFYAHP